MYTQACERCQEHMPCMAQIICASRYRPQGMCIRYLKKYGGLGVYELRELRQLKEENTRLKQMVADLSLDKQMLQNVLKKALRPVQLKVLYHYLIDNYRISIQRSNALISVSPTVFYYKARARRHSTSEQDS